MEVMQGRAAVSTADTQLPGGQPRPVPPLTQPIHPEPDHVKDPLSPAAAVLVCFKEELEQKVGNDVRTPFPRTRMY